MRNTKNIVRAAIVLCGILGLGGAVYHFEGTGRNQEASLTGEIESSSETDTRRYDHIIMTYPTISSNQTSELSQVVDAVNAISREKIGVEIELKLVDASESVTEYPLWITQGKQIDLMLINYQDIMGYEEQGMVQPLDGLLASDGSEINQISEEWGNLYSGTTIDNQIFGVAIPNAYRGSCAGLWVPSRYLEEIGFDYEENRIYSMEDLDGLFAQMKELYPDKYPLGQVPTSYNFSTYLFFQNINYDSLGSSANTGCIDIENGSTTMVNFYETEEYYNWLIYLRRWYQKGYIYPDAAITSASSIDLEKAGITMSIPQVGIPFFITEDTVDEPVVCLRLSEVLYGNNNSTGIFWTIPCTSKNPTAAMKFLNLMYSNAEITNLFQWGIEGQDYEKQEDGSVTWPKGMNSATVGYYNSLGLYGDQRNTYSLGSNEIKAKRQEFSEQAVSVGDEYIGFKFNSSAVGVQINQVQKVLDRYLNVLESGSVDLDEVYPEFIQELKEAGMDQVIAEKQRQFDAWLVQ